MLSEAGGKVRDFSAQHPLGFVPSAEGEGNPLQRAVRALRGLGGAVLPFSFSL